MRNEPLIRRELLAVWRTHASGKSATAGECMPDLIRGRFIKLARNPETPERIGYVAEVNPGNAGKTTVAIVFFSREDGEWKFVPGPLAVEVLELPHMSQKALRELVDSDFRFQV